MAQRRIHAGATGALLTAAMLGCGGSDPPVLPADEATRLRSQLTAVRSAATAGDRARATLALEAFRAAVRRQESAGNLSAATRASLERAISGTRRRIAAEVAAPPPAPAPVAVAPPVAAAPGPQTPPPGAAQDAANGKGNGNGKGKGKDKDKGHGK